MRKRWSCVQDFRGQTFVTEQIGEPPVPGSTEALLNEVASGLCGADVKVHVGEKETSGDDSVHRIPGHEGVGWIIDVGGAVRGLRVGDLVVLKPHLYPPEHARRHGHVDGPPCCGICSRHMGWEIDGVFTDYAVFPATNLVKVERRFLQRAASSSRFVPVEAVFVWTEPMACVLTFSELRRRWARELNGRERRRGRAAVVGLGPVGFLIALRLVREGWKVSLIDKVKERVAIARELLGRRSVSDTEPDEATCDLVVVTASSLEGINLAKGLVRDGGMVYLFAGLSAADRAAMDEDKVILFESIHRRAHPVKLTAHGKLIVFAGHSGYFDWIFAAAIQAVAEDSDVLGRAITGVIRGWTSSTVEHQWPGGAAWTTVDGSPAIVSLLHGTASLHKQHMKIVATASGVGKSER